MKGFRFSTDEVAIHKEGDRVILEPLAIERDDRGWPLALWELAGAAPEFDVGPRDAAHERDDVLGSSSSALQRKGKGEVRAVTGNGPGQGAHHQQLETVSRSTAPRD